MDIETRVKIFIYETIAQRAKPPTAAEVAASLSMPIAEVRTAFDRLTQARLLVLEPRAADRIRMAPPFSGVKTPFSVKVGDNFYAANCVWDALGIPAALHQDGDVITSCGYSGVPMMLQVRSGEPVAVECAIHFAVPAAQWWQDIIYT